jgi:hypothetical protein
MKVPENEFVMIMQRPPIQAEPQQEYFAVARSMLLSWHYCQF